MIMRFFQTFDNIIDDLRGKSLLLKKSRETVSLKNKEYQQKLQEYETLKEYFTKSATGRSIVDSIEDKFKSYNSSFLDLVKREEKIQNKLQKSIDSIYRKNPDIVKLQEYKNIIPENKFTELLVTLTKSHKQGLISKDRVLDLKKYKRVDLEKGSVYVKDDRTHYSDCIVINELNEVLLLKRNKLDSFEAAKYCLPGGHVDDGEDFQYAALRELIEETGIKSETAVPSGEYTDNKIVIHYFTVKVEKDKCNVFLDEREHQQYEWVSIDDIHNYPLIKNLDKNFEDVILIPTWVINHDLAPNFYIWGNNGSFLSKSEIKQVYLANKLYKSYKDGLMGYEHYKNHIKHNDIDVQMFSIYNLSQKPLYGLKLINSIEKSEKIEGGLADGKSIEEIATHHNTPVEQISEQLEMGVKVEMEHTNDREKAEEIAKDHLWEIPDYYTRLDKMESEAEDEIEKGKRAEIGEIREWNGIKMQKTAQGWFPVKKDSSTSKEENDGKVSSVKKQEQKKEYSEKELQDIAKKTSDSDLKNAASGGDEQLRIAAKEELERRNVEEAPKVEEKPIEKTKENKDTISHKKKQLEIILNNNPPSDEIHTWIRKEEDIKTAEEAFNESIESDESTPDFKKENMENALKEGFVTIYSSYPIRDGVFVTPSKMEAQSYAGKKDVFSKKVNLDDVAWIDGLQGQFAPINKIEETKKEDTEENEE